jgi:hypothetical protein
MKYATLLLGIAIVTILAVVTAKAETNDKTINLQQAAPAPPPPAYDHPYSNVRIIERKDLWMKYGMWSWTKQPLRPGDLCVIYHAPLGAALTTPDVKYVLDHVAFEQMIRHEMGHCHGLQHSGPDYYTDEWVMGKKPARIAPWEQRPSSANGASGPS